MADNQNPPTTRRLSFVNIDLLDPLLEAMLEGVLVPGSGNVVEFSFIPFVVDESDMDHHWHPGPMDVDYGEDEEDKEEDELEGVYGDEEEDYGNGEEEVEEDIENGEGEDDELGDGEEDQYEYSSQHNFEEGDEEDGNDLEYGYDVGDEDVDDDEDEEDDEEEDEYDDMRYVDDSVLANYGSLGWSICHNISDRKILHDTFNSRDFVRQMVEFFFTHLKQTSLTSTVSLHLLLNCLPSLVDLKILISKKKYTMKEALVIKVVLEMYENYYKTFGAPNFKVYHTEVIPLLLDFYNRLPDAALKLISKQLAKVLLNLPSLTSHFKLFHTQQEYINHYRDSTRRMRNLSEATDPSLFFR